MSELIDAIRDGTAIDIAARLALLPCFQGGFDAEHITATAIVAARDKPEDCALGVVQSDIFTRKVIMFEPQTFGIGDRVRITKERK